jgi:hypothetical protein
MLIIVSPAKKLDETTPAPVETHSQPELIEDARALIAVLQQKDSFQVADLMKLSMKLADLNVERYQNWYTPFTPENAKQAVYAFRGDVYQGLDADTLSEEDIAFAQSHMRILSGLYGLLKPLDLMQPYRLEMGTKLATGRGRDLYAFWGNIITDALNEALAAQGDDVLINLASNEYFKAVKPKALKGRIITPQFREYKNGAYKVVSFHAKRARGLMSRFIIEQRLSEPEAIKGFDVDDYRFNPELSDGDTWVFCR